MDTEKQKSFDNDIDSAIELTREHDEAAPDAKVYQFPESTPSEVVGDASSEEASVNEESPERRKYIREALSLGLVAAVAVLAAPRPGFMTENPEPPESPTTLLEGAEQAPMTPFDPDADHALFKVRVKKNNPAKNTPSEATFSDSRVVNYMATHPAESSALETSINSLPGSTEEIAIARRDVDDDGDLDTVALPVAEENSQE